ncbi:MAG: asparagine synthase-related protein [Phycisphaerales bacterium]
MITAFSGGVDSTLVAAAARRVLGKENAPAVIGDSPSLPRYELEQARQIARDLDLNLIEVKPGEQNDAGLPRMPATAATSARHTSTNP